MAFAAEGAPTPNTVNSSVARLITTILIILIAILGLLMIAGGVWSFVHLWNQRKLTRIPLRYYGMAIGMICGGLPCGAFAQALHLLFVQPLAELADASLLHAGQHCRRRTTS